MDNILTSKICGLCAGCKNAVNAAISALETHKNVAIFKEIVHNKSVNKKLFDLGIKVKNSLDEFDKNDFAILRAHGEPRTTYEFLKTKNIEFADCTCPNVKKIHELVKKYSEAGYRIIIIGKYGKDNGKIHPEIFGTMGWCETKPILIEDEEDLGKLLKIFKEKFYLVCQTTFNIQKAKLLAERIEEICKQNSNELIINLSICGAQTAINKAAEELAKNCDIMIVVGSPHSSNSTELFNNVSRLKLSIFLEDIFAFEEEFEKNNIKISANTKIGITAGASTDPEEILQLEANLEKYFLEKVMDFEVISHSAVRIDDMFFDPYNLGEINKKAKFIFITHPHYDHLSTEDIDKIILPDTTFIASKDCSETLEKFYKNHKKIYVLPNEKLKIADFEVETLPAYNISKEFHKKENGWVGFIIKKNGVRFYVVGDSDLTEETKGAKADVLFVPIGGTYTMTASEAASLANIVKPKLAVPTHYNLLVGSKGDEKIFLENVDKDIAVKTFL